MGDVSKTSVIGKQSTAPALFAADARQGISTKRQRLGGILTQVRDYATTFSLASVFATAGRAIMRSRKRVRLCNSASGKSFSRLLAQV